MKIAISEAPFKETERKGLHASCPPQEIITSASNTAQCGGPSYLPLHRPSFFLVGAPKAGTTSLYQWLRSHPDIFLPSVKEPHWFNLDDGLGNIFTLAEYESLFKDAPARAVAIGEATPWYLSSASAIEGILAYQPNARFIVCLRNPCDLAPAMHAEMYIQGLEGLDFATAWRVQDERRRGRRIPAFARATRPYQFGECCRLGEQLEFLLSRAGRDRVLPVLLDDVKADARAQYLRVLDFLGAPDDGRRDFPLANGRRTFRRPRLARLRYAVRTAKARLGVTRGLGLLSRAHERNIVPADRPEELPADLRAELRQYFAPDVALLGSLIGRNLTREWAL